VLIRIKTRQAATSGLLEPGFDSLELRGIEDSDDVPAGEAEDTAAFEGTSRAAHRLE
jgi:hypothetical protein